MSTSLLAAGRIEFLFLRDNWPRSPVGTSRLPEAGRAGKILATLEGTARPAASRQYEVRLALLEVDIPAFAGVEACWVVERNPRVRLLRAVVFSNQESAHRAPNQCG